MGTTTEPVREKAERPPEPAEDPGTRRLLFGMLTVLGVTSVSLVGLLWWLLRPADSGPPLDQPAGYPIEVVTTIYGYGQQPEEMLKTPLGVAFESSGNVWISNTGRSRVEVYGADGSLIRTIGLEGTGQLYSPYGIDIDEERGLVYVADMGNQIVQKYTVSGEHVGSLPDTGQDRDMFGPDGFTPYDVQVANGRVVVSSSDGLYFFDDDGAVVARWGGSANGRNIRGPGEGMFNFPDSFVHDPQTGWFFVADTGNRRVIAIDENGFWKWVSGTPDVEGKVTSFWQLPRSIEIGPDGNLYVVDTFRFDPEGMGTGHIVVLSKEGELLSEFGRAGEADGAFDFPDQIAAGPEGLFAVADRENDRVVVFRVGTALPAVDDLLARRYPEGFDEPEYVWVTPPPTPPVETGQD